MNFEQAREAFSNLQKRISAYNHATSLMFYDGETSAPSDTADNRLRSLEVLNDEIFRMKYGEDTQELLERLNENRDELTLNERCCVDFMQREISKKKNIPKSEYVRYELLLTETQDAWHKAHEHDDFNILYPSLKKVFETLKTFAQYSAPEKHPYEYYIDGYEEGATIALFDEYYNKIRETIPPLIQAINEKPQIDDSCLKGDFSAESQERLSFYLLELLGADMNRVSLATAEHPFTASIGSHFDERIATKYSRKDFTFSLYTVLYECGFVLYEMGQDDSVAYTVLDSSASLGLIESQGKFYENIIGRSRPFIECIYPSLVELFPNPVKNFTPDDIYRAVNKVSAGPVRMGSDELTNNIHLMIRYELEKDIFNGLLTVRDLPDAWRRKYKNYLGVDVKSPVQGVLQDIHWCDGAIGYFPLGVLGSIYSAKMKECINKEMDFDGLIREGNIIALNNWNKEKIWTKSGTHATAEIMSEMAGGPVNVEPYIDYLKEKYTEIYNL